MADLLIKGMEMPKDDILRIEICPNGQVNRIIGWAISEKKNAKAIELPPHGRLIDCDVLCKALLEAWHTSDKKAEAVISEVISSVITPLVSMIPTVVEASNGSDN